MLSSGLIKPQTGELAAIARTKALNDGGDSDKVSYSLLIHSKKGIVDEQWMDSCCLSSVNY